MKKLFPLVAILIALVLSRAEAKDPVSEVLTANYGEVIFVRQESNGSLNILESSITCDGWERIVLTGGSAASLFLRDGDYEFQAFSGVPYEPNSEPTACSSAALRVSVRKGKRVYIEVIPQSADEKLKFHWELKPKKG